MTFRISENAAGKTDAYGVEHDKASYAVRFKLMWGEQRGTNKPIIRGKISLDGKNWGEYETIAFEDTSGHKPSNEVPDEAMNGYAPVNVGWTVNGREAPKGSTLDLAIVPVGKTPGKAYYDKLDDGMPSWYPYDLLDDANWPLYINTDYSYQFYERNGGKVENGILHDATVHTVTYRYVWSKDHNKIELQSTLDGKGPDANNNLNITFNDTGAKAGTQPVAGTKTAAGKKTVTTTTTVTTKKAAAATASSSTSLPKTGDATNAAIPAAIAVAGAGIIGTAAALKRKDQRD